MGVQVISVMRQFAQSSTEEYNEIEERVVVKMKTRG